MPLPISTTLLLSALALSRIPLPAVRIIAYVFVGIAVANELLRTLVLRLPQQQPNEYQVPAQPRRQRTPIGPPDAS